MKRHIDLQELLELSLKAREKILRLCTKGGCFAGSALSAVDIILYLYKYVINKSSDRRDYFFLSKGHAVPALYSVLELMGLINFNWTDYHLIPDSNMYLHPNKDIKFVDFHSGSLGHLPAVASGVALDMKLSGERGRVFVMVGDGELNEGSIWEALLVASSYKLSNLTLIVDRNNIQANMPTEILIPLEPMRKKFESFGCKVYETDGHNFDYLRRSFDLVANENNKPSVIIAYTIRGNGVKTFEHRVDKWFVRLTEEEAYDLITEMYETNLNKKPMLMDNITK